MELSELLAALFNAKEEELRAKNKRLEIERQIEAAVGIPATWEGSTTNTVGNYKFKISRKILTKIDAEKLIGVAKEHNLMPQLQEVFRWSPEINKVAWDAASDDVIRAFSTAIERKPGKATFNVDLVSQTKLSNKKSNNSQEDTPWLF